jgi:hypothetical protein
MYFNRFSDSGQLLISEVTQTDFTNGSWFDIQGSTEWARFHACLSFWKARSICHHKVLLGSSQRCGCLCCSCCLFGLSGLLITLTFRCLVNSETSATLPFNVLINFGVDWCSFIACFLSWCIQSWSISGRGKAAHLKFIFGIWLRNYFNL